MGKVLEPTPEELAMMTTLSGYPRIETGQAFVATGSYPLEAPTYDPWAGCQMSASGGSDRLADPLRGSKVWSEPAVEAESGTLDGHYYGALCSALQEHLNDTLALMIVREVILARSN
jgi:hypothetical protein